MATPAPYDQMSEEQHEILRLLVVLTVVLVAGCSAPLNSGSETLNTDTGSTLTDDPEVVDREVTSGTVSLEGLPVAHSFRFQNGETHLTFPITVEFQRPVDTNWTTVHAFNVSEMEWLTVELTPGHHYRIFISDSEGERRMMGLYTPGNHSKNNTVVIGGCCIDDFS